MYYILDFVSCFVEIFLKKNSFINGNLNAFFLIIFFQGQDIFNCLLCSKSFTSKEYLDLHLQRKHTEKLEEPIRKTNEETRVDVELKTSLDRLREDVERQERLMREKNSDLEKTIEYKSVRIFFF